ncbi:esterase [Kineosporia sp. NBRC 101677]|uniref:alpha/beta hydrolase n=1 Tax=Kineosporia sp. NBRC 101677 TaxID=3032197 RepID=UPI0024A13FA7|nr:alpha/beta hydrolase [Kineosporia sp. NBRC 101677]GLY17165.1 esterase [Kineosporia sp. NBRC 101677]
MESLTAYLDAYAERSRRARTCLEHQPDLAYGPAPAERLDFFPGPDPDCPLVVYVHGGNWQALSRQESAFAAPDAHRAGIAFAAIGYGLAPDNSLPSMVASVRGGLTWLHDNATTLGFDADRIHVAGSSAGAHLVAAAVLSRTTPVAGCVLLSGMYDLEPVRHSYVNDALRLDATNARALSPIHHLHADCPPVIMARGENETDEYARQHREMAHRLKPAVDLVVPGRNHFDLPYDLLVKGTTLGDAVLTSFT